MHAPSRAMLRFILDSNIKISHFNININKIKIAVVVGSYTMGIQGFCRSVGRRVHLQFYRGQENECELKI